MCMQIDPETLERLRREKKTKALEDYAERAKKDEPETFTKKSLFRIINNVQACRTCVLSSD